MNSKMIRFLQLSFLLLVTLHSFAQNTPREFFSYQPGDDFKLIGYDSLYKYYNHVAQTSNNVIIEEIGKSELGKPLLLITISSEENLKDLSKYKRIAKEQAIARIRDDKSQANVREGKAVVWIDAGLHATERATSQMIPQLLYDLATDNSEEYQNIRSNVITLIMPVMNPDGLEIVEKWYKANLGTPYETTSPPRLYHYYAGHDNNRDWFMNNLSETKAVNNILYNEWYPQIVLNHHQTSPSWARIFVPPFADPVNPNIHPAIVTGTNIVGMSMANRLALKGMPGVVSNYRFSMWWNGGMRTVPYFHNMIGILTETAHATPTPRMYNEGSVPKYIGGQFPSDGSSIFYSNPWKGGESKFSGAVSYMYEASMALLNLAADRKESYLRNIYQIGRDILDQQKPYAYILPKNQKDYGEVLSLAEILKNGGIEIEILDKSNSVAGNKVEEGSVVIYSNQSFHPYIKDLLTKQEYPIQKKYPGGPVKPPYDLAGWTLPYQMDVEVIEVKNKIDLETSPLTDALKKGIFTSGKGNYFQFSAEHNDSYKLINRLTKEGIEVHFDKKSKLYIAEISPRGLEKIGQELVMNGEFIKSRPEEDTHLISTKKVGIYKSWVANMDEGWTRFVLDQYEFDWDTLHDDNISQSDLSIYDAIILPSQSSNRILNGHTEGTMPPEFCGGLGIEGTLKLQKYVQNGGTLISFDKASNFVIDQFGLPLKSTTKGVESSKFFIPGSLISAEVSMKNLLTVGMSEEVSVSFSRSNAFDIIKKSNKGEGGLEYTVDKAPTPAVNKLVSYSKENILKSGYATNPKKYIGGKIAMASIADGKGQYIVFGFRPQFRGQSHATYKLIFNSIFFSNLTSSEMAE